MKLKRKKCQKWHFFVTPYGTNKMMPQNVKTSNARNYQRELDKILEQVTTTQRLFLHSCCAPCSSYVLEYLRRYFEITVFYYNPNISADEEYQKRVAEQKRLIEAYNKLPDSGYPIDVMEGDYEPRRFMRLQRDWNNARRAVSAVLPAMSCALGRRQSLQDSWIMTILRRHLPSVR